MLGLEALVIKVTKYAVSHEAAYFVLVQFDILMA